MPELPEVETVVRGLQKVLSGRRVVSVRLGKTDFIDDPVAVEQELPGKTILAVKRFGKFLLFDLESPQQLENGTSLLIHLGMTGQLRTCPAEAPVLPHTHVFLGLNDGRELRYTDIRRFGRFAVLKNGAREVALGGLGLDPLEASEKQFCERLRGRRARMKALLLDQRVFRGIGNIYADESLWRARIHPMQLAAKLSEKNLRDLYKAVQKVLTDAIRLRGSSVSDYVDSEGQRGGFQQRHRVYQRHGEKCSRCAATIRRATVAGRSSHFCPRCQPSPRQQKSRSLR